MESKEPTQAEIQMLGETIEKEVIHHRARFIAVMSAVQDLVQAIDLSKPNQELLSAVLISLQVYKRSLLNSVDSLPNAVRMRSNIREAKMQEFENTMKFLSPEIKALIKLDQI